MLMTVRAMQEMPTDDTTLRSRCASAVARFFGFGVEPPRRRAAIATPSLQIDVDAPASTPTTDESAHAPQLKWRKHPLLRRAAESAALDPARDARCEVVRGLFAARAGALDSALDHFVRAAATPSVDLTTVPGFWYLDRRAMYTAVTAYEQVGRVRDAAALAARIRTTFRPRVIGGSPTKLVPLTTTISRSGTN